MNLIVTHLGISDCLFLFTESNELKLREWLRERYEQAVDTLIDHLRHESSSVKVHCPWSYNISYIRAIHTHPLIHRYIDTPLHWYTVTLVHRYIDTLQHCLLGDIVHLIWLQNFLSVYCFILIVKTNIPIFLLFRYKVLKCDIFLLNASVTNCIKWEEMSGSNHT